MVDFVDPRYVGWRLERAVWLDLSRYELHQRVLLPSRGDLLMPLMRGSLLSGRAYRKLRVVSRSMQIFGGQIYISKLEIMYSFELLQGRVIMVVPAWDAGIQVCWTIQSHFSDWSSCLPKLPHQLVGLHPAFHVSKLWKADVKESEIMDYRDWEILNDVSIVEKSVQILDWWEQILRGKVIPLVMVLWSHHGYKETA